MARRKRRSTKRGGSGLRKARCVRKKMSGGMNKTSARKACGVKKR